MAGVSLLRRTGQAGVFALLARREVYRTLTAPVFAPSFEALERWPHAIYRQPGERAAMALRARGKRIVEVSSAAAAPHLADFSGADRDADRARGVRQPPRPALRDAPRGKAGPFAAGAYDNILLGALFRAVFGAPYADGARSGALRAAGRWRTPPGKRDPRGAPRGARGDPRPGGVPTSRRILRKLRSRAHPPRGPRRADPAEHCTCRASFRGRAPSRLACGPRRGGSSGRVRTGRPPRTCDHGARISSRDLRKTSSTVTRIRQRRSPRAQTGCMHAPQERSSL